MSGIFGIIRLDGDAGIERDLRRMAKAIAHRGPDRVDFSNDGRGGVGHALMRITVEDRFDQQPVHDPESGIVLVADVRLDNREALADLLDITAGSLATMSDSALLMAAWRAWGEGCVDRLLGDFAFAVWDGQARRLVLARDHIGQRSLHFHLGDGFLAFASEAKALIALPQVPRALRDQAMIRWVLRDPQGADEQNFLEGINSVRGGTTVTVERDGIVSVRRYWSPAPDPAYLGQDADTLADAYRRLLAEAVACRVRRLIDPPGLLLSGGFDSSAIAGLSVRSLAAGHRLVTVTSALPEGAPPNERDARPGAQWCIDHLDRVDHHWFVAEAQTLLDGIDLRSHVADRPPYPLGYADDAMLQILRRGGARLVMDGIGGDATINPRISRLLPMLVRAGKFGTFWREWHAEARVTGVSRWHLLRRRVLPGILPRGLWRRWLSMRMGTQRYVHPYVNAQLADPLVEAGVLQPHDPRSILDQRSDLDRRIATLHLLMSRGQPNRANEAAAFGLELTRPMLDKRLIELGLAIPPEMQVVNGRNRAMALKAIGDILPPEFRTRRRGQEYLDATFSDRQRALLPHIRDQLGLMRDHPVLRRYLDLDRMERDVALAIDHPDNVPDIKFLVHSFLIARYVAWFNRLNL